MNYLASISEQSRVFFYACGFGFMLGIYYELFTLVRCFARLKKGMTVALDIIFCVSSGFAVFIYSLAVNNGKPEFHFFFGVVAGFLAYYFTLGLIALKAAQIAGDALFCVCSFLFGNIGRIGKKLSEKSKEVKKKSGKKSKKTAKILLQDERKLLYN